MNRATRGTKQRSKNGSTTGVSKESVRKTALLTRNSLSESCRRACSDAIGTSLRALAAYRKAQTIMFYVTHGSEVITDHMITQALREGKTVTVPAIASVPDRSMRAARIASLKQLAPGAYGIREPLPGRCPEVAPEEIDLIVVPGIAFDATGHRIGYGKGYYDKWLRHVPLRKRIGLAFGVQLVKRIPRSSHDEPVGSIVTETTIVRTQQPRTR